MTSSSSAQVILGIDPGTQVTGYALIRITGNTLSPLDFGCIRTPSKSKLSDRYLILFESVSELIEMHKPTELAIETPFVYKNSQSAIKLGSAMGVCFVAAKRKGMAVFGYSPKHVKSSITGTGKASKDQVETVIARSLGLRLPINPQDASDALAIALNHIYHLKNVFSTTKYEM